MTDRYYNTDGENDGELEKSKRQVSKQEEIVLKFFRQYPHGMSPSTLHRHRLQDAPLTSVRRAMTNLTQAGHLEKLDAQAMGIHGKREHLWRLAPVKPAGMLF